MLKTDNDKTERKKALRKDRAAEIANTFEWMITAFILAFFFRAFVMEAFRIPTGSMANTLMGAHFQLRCTQCGYEYEYGFIPQNYGLNADAVPSGNVGVKATRCPSCGYYQPAGGSVPVSKGDRILVLKCLYQFFEPKRWDVTVFKNPLEPSINYIKRLVGLPGETLEIIDGDVYIDGQISRKPEKVQNELWMPVYDNDYQPVRPDNGSFNGHKWEQPLNDIGSRWVVPEDRPTQFVLQSQASEINWLNYDMSLGNDLRATYAYNDVRMYGYRAHCSDLMVRFYVSSEQTQYKIGVELSKYGIRYRAWIDPSGEIVLSKVSDGQEAILVRKEIAKMGTKKAPTLLKFANVDHRLIFQYGSEKLVYDLGRLPDDAGPLQANIAPEAKIFGAGSLTLSHIAIFRDIYYTSADGSELGTGTQGNAVVLGKDDFFMLGDNSPNSADSRWWSIKGRGNNGRSYREGIVPREYLVGKALFVYWPSGFRALSRSSFGIIPNVGKMRLIYGGSNAE